MNGGQAKSTLHLFASSQGPQGTRELARPTVWTSVGVHKADWAEKQSSVSAVANSTPRHHGGGKKLHFSPFSGFFCDFFCKFMVVLSDL
jgi:hypothetical protein